VAEPPERLTIDGAEALSVAVINTAMVDIEGRGMSGPVSVVGRTWGDYVKAVLWAGSSRATIWFEVLGWSQIDYLRAMRWDEHAERLMRRSNLTTKQVQFLRDGRDALRPIPGDRKGGGNEG
jgi:hypothetical protein|tara:strand:- start:12266 stop:12631 length:366 start_codon:yes stop_codon:yes gene_type:complete